MGNYKRKSREERLEEIFIAATEVFLEKGYRNATMEDIVAATSLSKGGLYYYFGSKKEILAEIIRYKNYWYLKRDVSIKKGCTKEEICDILAKTFVERMMDSTPKQRMHLMIAYELVYEPEFEELYVEIEEEPLKYLSEVISIAYPKFDTEKAKDDLMLLYRINNTLHFVKNLYSTKESFFVNPDLLYTLYYQLLLGIMTD